MLTKCDKQAIKLLNLLPRQKNNKKHGSKNNQNLKQLCFGANMITSEDKNLNSRMKDLTKIGEIQPELEAHNADSYNCLNNLLSSKKQNHTRSRTVLKVRAGTTN